jgi:hypothetical protein
MQGQYRGNRGVRPRVVSRSGHDDASSARLFICLSARDAALSRWFAVAATVARSIAPEAAAGSPGDEANGPPVRVTKPAAMDGARMPSGHAGTGHDAKK